MAASAELSHNTVATVVATELALEVFEGVRIVVNCEQHRLAGALARVIGRLITSGYRFASLR